MKDITLPVAGMDCGGCVKAVEKALAHTPGVISGKADLAGASATIQYDEAQVSPAALAEVITRAGFKSSVPA